MITNENGRLKAEIELMEQGLLLRRGRRDSIPNFLEDSEGLQNLLKKNSLLLQRQATLEEAFELGKKSALFQKIKNSSGRSLNSSRIELRC